MSGREPRLRVVGHNDTGTTELQSTELTEQQVTQFAASVAAHDHEAVSHTLDQMNAGQLRSLALALAHQVNATEIAEGDVPDVGPEAICAIAVSEAATAFGTTRDAMLSADRHRNVTDARAVAMTAARRTGLTLPAIGSYFNKDHTSVMYAQTKVAHSPRLNAACVRIIDRIDNHYGAPTSTDTHRPFLDGPRSSTLQLAALSAPTSAITPAEAEHGADLSGRSLPAPRR